MLITSKYSVLEIELVTFSEFIVDIYQSSSVDFITHIKHAYYFRLTTTASSLGIHTTTVVP